MLIYDKIDLYMFKIYKKKKKKERKRNKSVFSVLKKSLFDWKENKNCI